jgi:hypothetical protein
MRSETERIKVSKYLKDRIMEKEGTYLYIPRPGLLGLPELMHFWADGRVNFLEVMKPNKVRQRHLGTIQVRKVVTTGHSCYWIDSKHDVDRYFEGTLPEIRPKPLSC